MSTHLKLNKAMKHLFADPFMFYFQVSFATMNGGFHKQIRLAMTNYYYETDQHLWDLWKCHLYLH